METQHFRKQYSAAMRVWHWLNAFAILGLLGTVLLRKTFLSWRTNSAYIQNTLMDEGIEISSTFARSIAVGIRDPMWDWHYVFGYTLAGLLLARTLLFIFKRDKEDSILMHWKRFTGASYKSQAAHKLLVKCGYMVFYVMTAFMVGTGLAMIFNEDLGLERSTVGSIKDIHELSMWFFVAFTALHLIGVIIAELTADKGIISDMISGRAKK